MATLTAKNLAKAYKGRRVVEDVSLTVNSGEIVGLLGPNGAGKTTTFYMVVGIVPRDAGNIIIDDELLYKHSLKLADYDFASEVDVNILRHIFENSLNELELTLFFIILSAVPLSISFKKLSTISIICFLFILGKLL